MGRDRSKFSKIQEPSLEEFAKWVLSEEFTSRKRKPSTLDDAWIFYCFYHERQVVNRKNYKYWVEWMNKNRTKALYLYPCHSLLFMQRENEIDNI